MKILITARYFLPHLGGSIDSCLFLARGLSELGHDVVVLTRTAKFAPTDDTAHSFRVVRNASLIERFRLARRADVSLQIEPSLIDGLLVVLAGRPVVPTLHTLSAPEPTLKNLAAVRLQKALLRLFPVIAVSRFVAKDWGVRAITILTTYDDFTFRPPPAPVQKVTDVVYLGRHIPEKGIDVLVDALKIMASCERAPTAVILGDGPMRSTLEAQVAAAGLSASVTFRGRVSTDEVIDQLQRSRILAVPSVWEEPLGLVVMQGLACGCRVVASRAGGIREAGGDCAIYVEANDPAALAEGLTKTLACADERSTDEETAVARHLAKFSRARFVRNYERVLKLATMR